MVFFEHPSRPGRRPQGAKVFFGFDTIVAETGLSLCTEKKVDGKLRQPDRM